MNQASASHGSSASHGTDAPAERLQLVSFVIEGEEFGIDILNVQEIIRPLPITRVPDSPPFVEGVVNLRGRIVPIIDARKRFGLPTQAMTEASRIVVVQVGTKTVGFVMDAVREVIRVERSMIEPPPEMSVGIDADYISGIAKLEDRLLILLDVERILHDEEQQHLPKAEALAA